MPLHTEVLLFVAQMKPKQNPEGKDTYLESCCYECAGRDRPTRRIKIFSESTNGGIEVDYENKEADDPEPDKVTTKIKWLLGFCRSTDAVAPSIQRRGA